jgi:hypothetical protein
MSIDIVDLRSFYASPLGEVTRDLLMTAIRNRWDNLGGLWDWATQRHILVHSAMRPSEVWL